MPISPFFDSFSKVQYNISGRLNGDLETVTNIFHRMGYIKDVLNNVSSYYLYEIQDGDTPEVLAEKVYGDAGAGWMIIYANNIVDPQWDWPVDDETFKNFIISKYGSLSAASTGVHHYEKVVETTIDGVTTVRTYGINEKRLTDNALDVPYEYYNFYRDPNGISIDTTTITVDTVLYTADNDCFATGDTSLPHYDSYVAYDVNGKTATVNTYGRAVSYYDYEITRNDNNRTIKVIKATYYRQIMNEFKELTQSLPKYVRTFV